MKQGPMRSCIVCKETKDKSELLRIVRRSDGEIVLDVTGREPGRGAYVCDNPDCVYGMKKRRALSRAFKQNYPQEVYERIEAAYKATQGSDGE